MKRIVAFLLVFLLLPIYGCKSTEKEFSATRILLDTAVQITIYSGGSNDILEECFNLCQEYEQLFSTTILDSDISRINSSDGKPLEVNPQTAELLRLSYDYSKLSDGVFDITVLPLKELWDFKAQDPKLPDNKQISNALASIGYNNVSVTENTVTLKNNAKVDLGGIAKGYIADRLCEYLKSQNVTCALVNLGGNVACVGEKSGGFKIGVKKPYSLNEVLKTIQIDNGSVVTSGCYERYFTLDDKQYHHILDTKTGYPVDNDLAGVTVISENSALADFLSTTLYALGYEKALQFLQDQPAEAVFVFKDNSVRLSDGLEYEDKDTIILSND